LYEQIKAVGFKFLICEWMWRGEMLTEIAQCLSDIGEANLVLPTNGIQYMDFHDIHEGNQGAVRVGGLN
jgi:hypothetical protein